MKKKDNFGIRKNQIKLPSGPIRANSTNSNLGGRFFQSTTSKNNYEKIWEKPLSMTTAVLPNWNGYDGERNPILVYYTSIPIAYVVKTSFLISGMRLAICNENIEQEIILTANVAIGDTTLSVESFNPIVTFPENSYIRIDRQNLLEQYQNKTEGTIAGFTIDADGLTKDGVEITGWLNSDTMAGASVNNLPTALSVKNYVDGQVGASDTLAEVLANGNVTGGTDIVVSANDDIVLNSSGATYSKLIGNENSSKYFALENGSGYGIWSSYQGFVFRTAVGNTERMRLTTTGLGIGTSAPASILELASATPILTIAATDNTVAHGIEWKHGTTIDSFIKQLPSSGAFEFNVGRNSTWGGDFKFVTDTYNSYLITRDLHRWFILGAEKMRITSTGNVGIGTTSPSANLDVTSNLNQQHLNIQGAYGEGIGALARIKTTANGNALLIESATLSDSREILEVKNSNGTVFKIQGDGNATFTGQVTIPATPEASTDAASKGYVDAQVGTADTLSEVLALGNTTGGTDIEVSNGDNIIPGTNIGSNLGSSTKSFLYAYTYVLQSAGILQLGAGGSEKMRITSTGNVLIGTTSDDGSKLRVEGNTNVYGDLKITSTMPSLYFTDLQQDDWRLMNDNGDFRFTNIDGTGHAIIINTNNNITLGGSLTGTTATFSTEINTPSTFNFTGNNGYIKVGTAWNTGVLNFLNGATTYLKFDVPNGRIQNNLGKYLTASGAVAQFGSMDNVDVSFVSNSAEKMRITSAGNVGIGTTNPLSALDVQGNIELSGVLKGRGSDWTYYSIPSGDGSYPHLFYTRTNGGASLLRAKIGGGAVVGSTEFTNNNFSINSNQLYVKQSTGNVGIGTTAPSTKLDLIGGGPSATFRLSNSSSDNTVKYGGIIGRHYKNSEEDVAGMLITSSSNATAQSVIIGGGISGVNAVNIVAFYTGADYTTLGGTERMRINNAGNVGIGTTAPSTKLDVAGTGKFTGQITAGYGIKFTNGNTDFLLYNNPSENVLYLRDTTNGAMITTWSVNNFGVNKNLNGTTATFTGQVTIPATPEASTDAASKGYVDAQVGTADTLSEVLALGNTSGGTNIDISPNDVIDFFTGANLNYGRIKADSEGLTIDTVANRHMRFMKAGVETMRINTSGNVGIGTTSPTEKLHVIGKIISQEGTVYTQINASGQDSIILNSGTGNIRMFNGGGEKLRLTNAGNVLIGTTTDSGGKLQVQAATSSYLLFKEFANQYQAGIQSQSHLVLASNETNAIIEYRSGDYQRWLVNTNEKMRITSAGYLGIGTTSPSRKLDVEGRIRFSSNSNQTVNGYGEIYTSYAYGKGQTYIAPEGVTNPANFHPNGGVTIGAASTSPPANGLIVAGKVGIGITTPTHPLQVEGDARIRGQLMVGNSSPTNTPNATLHIKASGTDAKLRIEDLDNANKYFDFLVDEGNGLYINEESDTRLSIKEGGNVGIGTSTPSEELHVVGDTLITGGLKVNAANIDFTGLGTSDPAVAGRLYSDRGILKISAG